jgi:hypothetical protein
MLLSVDKLPLLIEARKVDTSKDTSLHTVILIGHQQKQQQQFRFELATHELHCLFYDELFHHNTDPNPGGKSFQPEELPCPDDIAQAMYVLDGASPRVCWASHRAALAGVSSIRQLLRNSAPPDAAHEGVTGDEPLRGELHFRQKHAGRLATRVAALAAAERAAARHSNPDDVVYVCSGGIPYTHPANRSAIHLSLCLGGCVLLTDDSQLGAHDLHPPHSPSPTFVLLRPPAVSELCEMAMKEIEAMHATWLLKLLLRAKVGEAVLLFIALYCSRVYLIALSILRRRVRIYCEVTQMCAAASISCGTLLCSTSCASTLVWTSADS